MSGHGERPSRRDAVRVVLLATIALLLVLPLRSPAGLGGLLALGLLTITGYALGVLAARIHLPRLTGFLVAGIALGPQATGVVGLSDVKSLSVINALALALIALQAGAELTVPTLTRTLRSILTSATAQVLLVIPLMAATFYGLAPHIGFTADKPPAAVVALAVLWGALAMTRSPAVTLAVVAETGAKGPLTDFALGSVVLLDVVVLPVFALALGLTRAELLGDVFDASAITHLISALFSSLAAGVTFGLLLSILLKVAARERVLVLVALGYMVSALCDYLRYDTLLVFVVAGSLVSNLTQQGPTLLSASTKTSTPVMIVFFATAGAKLDLLALVALWPVALTLFAARVAVTFVAVRLGHRAARDAPVVKKYAWLSLVSQAGVTIGFATIVGDALPGVGTAFASLVVAVVGLNELVGAVLFKWSLARGGELPGTNQNRVERDPG